MELIRSEIKGLPELLREVDGKHVSTGLARGLKKIGGTVKTRAVKTIREQYNLKKADVDKTFTVRATAAQVVIACQSRPINLTYFGAKQLGSAGGKRKTIRRQGDEIKKSIRGRAGAFAGVTAPIEKGHTTLLQAAFIARMRAGSKGGFTVGVFSRTSHASRTQYQDKRDRRTTGRPYVKKSRPAAAKPRQAIINRAFVSVPTLFGGKTVMPVINQYLDNEALKTVAHEIEFAQKGR